MSRYGGPPRDRSPPRFSDRRPSSAHNHPPAHLAFRAGADVGQNSNREIPRGPKADTLRHAGPPTPRVRGGFTPRPDFRDREAVPPFRRDNDRLDWPRRDREFPEQPPLRDTRPFHPRDRSMSPRMSDPAPMWHGSGGRGGSLRARGRADWERGRSRPFLPDRDGFGPRSRSREGRRDRDRDWEGPDVEHKERFDRRGNERSRERDDRDRDPVRRHDPSPTRNSTGNQTTGPSRLATVTSLQPSHAAVVKTGRRFSTTLTPIASGREVRRESDRNDQFSAGIGAQSTDQVRRPVSPPPAPTVPAFGSSLEYVKPAEVPSETGSSVKPVTISQPGKSLDKPAGASQETPFQPPTGPKADRAIGAAAPLQKDLKAYGSDLRVKPEIQPRTVRSAMVSTSTAQAAPAIGPPRNESWESFAGSGAESKPFPQKEQNSKPAPSTPSTISVKRTDPMTSKALPPKTPPAIPTGPAAMEGSPNAQKTNIPTGPRIQPKQYSHHWGVPGYKALTAPARPSIMNSAPSKPLQAAQRERNYGLPTSHRNNADPFVGHNIKPRAINTSTDKHRDPTLPQREVKPEISSEKSDPSVEPEGSTKADALLSISLAQSSDEEADDDDDGLDEEDFADSERKFKKEMDLLAMKRPLSPLRDPAIVGLLVRIQLLGMIADGSAPAGIAAEVVMEEVETEKSNRPIGLPSPVVEEEREDSPQPSGRLLKEAPYNPIPTPPIEDLPFLSVAADQSQCTFDTSDEDEETYGSIIDCLCQEFTLQARETELQRQQLKQDFSNLYRPWRHTVATIDRKKREENPLTPVPASPPSSAAPTLVPTPLIERTRGAKNITELDLQNILKASEQSAREEQERRDRELTARPNYEMEAVIPAMLDCYEIESSFFEDSNRLVPESNALDAFAFLPPQDDFSAEEQKAFITAFNTHPKRWSEIADCLPGRDYQQCIFHYYLTKHAAKYKDLWRKTLPKKKRGRGPAVRPRSTALMSDLVYERDEVDGTPAAVTDTGRPRRAAAPTFGEPATDVETPVVPAAAPRKLAKEPNGEQSGEKSTTRKRAGTKGPRKAKSTAGPGTGPSPQRVEKDIKAAKVNGKLDSFGPKADEASVSDIQLTVPGELEQNRPATMLISPSVDGTTSGRPSTNVRSVSQQSSSYWSVPETIYFPTLVEYFGRDWTGISNFMETKTSNMVSLVFIPKPSAQSLQF